MNVNFCSSKWSIANRVASIVRNHDIEDSFESYGLIERLIEAGWGVLEDKGIFIPPGKMERYKELNLGNLIEGEDYLSTREDVFNFLMVSRSMSIGCIDRLTLFVP